MKRTKSALAFLLTAWVFFAVTSATAFAMQVFIELQVEMGSRSIALEVEPTDTIADVKRQIEGLEAIPADRQILTFAGKELLDENTLQDYSIQKGSTLCLALRADPPAGTGSESDPYRITSAQELFWFARQVNGGQNAISAKLMGDIHLEHLPWTPIGNDQTPYTGVFDGGGFTVSGCDTAGTADYQGLFGYCKNGTVQNLCTAEGLICGQSFTGGIIGYAENTRILNCVNGNDISSQASSNGGLVGKCVGSTIADCINTGDLLKGGYQNGGIVGTAEGSLIERCINEGHIRNTDHSGGIAGYHTSGTLSDCLNLGDITTTGAYYCYTAGIVANNRGADSIVKNCLNMGRLSGTGGYGCRVNAIVCATDENGTDAQNCYAKEGTGSLGAAVNSKAVTEQELGSGQVAWWLNEQRKGVWGQDIGADTYPHFSGEPVYPLAGGAFGPVCDHTYDPRRPSCTQGVVCSVCETAIPAAGHRFAAYTPHRGATCTQDATEMARCENCEVTDTRAVPGTARGHAFEGWRTVKTPGCQEKGVRQRSCTSCGTVQTEGLDLAAHQWADHFTTDREPTCTENGRRSVRCLGCGVIQKSELLKATGHLLGEWKVTKDAAPAEEGERTRLCERCGYAEKEVIPALSAAGEEPADSAAAPGGDSGEERGGQARLAWYLPAAAAAVLGIAVFVIGKKKKR